MTLHPLAHSPPRVLAIPVGSAEWEQVSERLCDHLREVARRARALAEAAAPDRSPLSQALVAAAEAAGWLHDLGKYRVGFQEYIRGRRSPGDPETWHKQAGAAWAWDARHYPLALAILGHHGGMPDVTGGKQTVTAWLMNTAEDSAVRAAATRDCPELTRLTLSPPPLTGDDHLGVELFTRLVFSCLVDADWTATGEYERRALGLAEESGPNALDPGDRLGRVLEFIRARAAAVGDTPVSRVRRQVLEACLAASDRPPGVFTLTVPTGGGKTLSGLAFALKHAAVHGLRRVIYVAPYLSIIEQNAEVIRQALGLSVADPDVFEHHSLAEPISEGDEQDRDDQSRVAATRRAENWDAPVVVTTNVQFLESLFGNKPSRCRKLHNIARSVVILDECQALPPGLVAPTCGMLRQLVEKAGCTVVLCTATQPAFDHERLGTDRLRATEIIPAELDLFTALRRVRLQWPEGEERWSWAEVAERMLRAGSSLCVVNTRQAARDLFRELRLRRPDGDGVYHLSTYLFPAHRLEVLRVLQARLRSKKPVYLVSTQLIEAGVDISFPTVFRELAPLEGVVQAAGRCNREGEIPDAGGNVIVFRSLEEAMPPGWYRLGADQLLQSLRTGTRPRIDRAEDIRNYYERLYYSGNLDANGIVPLRRSFNFPEVAEKYRLIDDGGIPVVIHRFEPYAQEVAELLHQVRHGPRRRTARRQLGRFQVNLLRGEVNRLQQRGLICSLDDQIELLGWFGDYDPNVGVVADGMNDVLIV